MSDKIDIIEHDNGVLEVIFLGNDRATVDAYMELMERTLVATAQTNAIARVMINLVRSGVPPIAYITKQGRKILHEHADERDNVHLRGAFVANTDDSIVLSLAETFMRLLPIDANMKIFKPENRDDAMEWLTTDG